MVYQIDTVILNKILPKAKLSKFAILVAPSLTKMASKFYKFYYPLFTSANCKNFV